jgi:hypothetical protein
MEILDGISKTGRFPDRYCNDNIATVQTETPDFLISAGSLVENKEGQILKELKKELKIETENYSCPVRHGNLL